MDYQTVGAPGAANYAAPMMNFGIPGVTDAQGNRQLQRAGDPRRDLSQPQTQLQGVPDGNDWMTKLRQYLMGGGVAPAGAPGVAAGAVTPATNAAATGTSPQPPNPYNQASPYYPPGIY